MFNTSIKQLLGLVFVAALLAGCSSTPETDTTTDSSANTGSQSDVSVGTGGNNEVVTPPPAPPAPDTVFYFEFDSSVLNAEARQALQAHAAILKGNSQRIRLEGHCDERGTREYNQALGARRANAVADYLVLQGVSRSRIETISYGEERPADARSNESAWAMNRRVELQ